jgi:hypothetical protein
MNIEALKVTLAESSLSHESRYHQLPISLDRPPRSLESFCQSATVQIDQNQDTMVKLPQKLVDTEIPAPSAAALMVELYQLLIGDDLRGTSTALKFSQHNDQDRQQAVSFAMISFKLLSLIELF